MFSNELMLGVAKLSSEGIGVAGELGFGVGVYPGDEADLTGMGLSKMEGCDDPSSDNFGNYIHTNGSVMCFVPAFCYRIGNANAPSYSRDTVNALEIRSATDFDNYKVGSAPACDMGDGWVLHRAFIDGGVQKSGFFIDKYLCSKSEINKNIAVSVKNADPLQLTKSSSENTTIGMTNCDGCLYDALTLSTARGSNYGCMTVFMFSALGMLSMAHGQSATSYSCCAWFDHSYKTNYPKGNNNLLLDIDDESITFTKSSLSSSSISKTGSASYFSKCTHNGQNCGVYGVNGDLLQVVVGFAFKSYSVAYVLSENVSFTKIGKSNFSNTSFYRSVSIEQIGNKSGDVYWNAESPMFYSEASDDARAIAGVLPRANASTSMPINCLFGKDSIYLPGSFDGVKRAFYVGGSYGATYRGGIWSRLSSIINSWSYYGNVFGFRAAGYAS